MNAFLTLPIDEPLPVPRAPRRALPVLNPAGDALPDRSSARPRPLIASRVAPPPRSVRVSVTDRCDFACTYCRPSHTDGYADGRLRVSVWRTMFEGLKKAGVQRVRLTGGEPLIHPEILAIVTELAA